jgi:hypothetical protein
MVTQKWIDGAPEGAQGALSHFESLRTDITLKPNLPPTRNTIQRTPSDRPQQSALIRQSDSISKPFRELIHPRPARELKRKPKPPMRLELRDCDERVLACLQGIEGLQPGDGNSLVATHKLSKEAAGSIAKAVGLLLEADPPNVKRACTLVLMCEPAARFALAELCQPEWMDLLVRSDPKVGHAMERAFNDAAHDAIHAKAYRQFFELVSGCDVTAASSLSKILPALTEEMVQGFDSDVFIKAMNMTLKSAQEAHPYECLHQLHSLLSIAGTLEKKSPGRALAMKCLIWPALNNLFGKCPPDEIGKLQDMALLPELSAELLGSLPGSLQGDLLCVKVDQIMNWPGNEQKVDDLLRLAALYSEIDLELAAGLESAINEALDQWPDDQRPSGEERTQLARPDTSGSLQVDFRQRDFNEAMVAGDLSAAARVIRDSRGLSRENGARALFKAVSARLGEVGIEVHKHTASPLIGEEAASKRIAVVREMAVILIRTGEPYDIETAARIFALVDPDPKRFIQLLLREGLGIAGYSLSDQMARALPMLCDGAHLAELAVIVGSHQGQELIAQALIDYHLMGFWNVDITDSLIPTLVPRIDLRAALSSRRDSTEKTAKLEQLLVQHLIAGEPSHAEAARIILVQLGMWFEKDALALLKTYLGEMNVPPFKLTLALLVLCSAKPLPEFDFFLKDGASRYWVTRIVMDCFEHHNPSATTVALLFEGLAHRLDLRNWTMVGTRLPGVARGMATIKLGGEIVQGIHKWAPGWRSLLLISLDSKFCNPGWLAAAEAVETSSGIVGSHLRSLKRPEVHEFLNAMMSVRLPGTDTPLFPADVINNVMRAFMTQHDLAVSPEWIQALPKEQRVRWWKAMVLVFNDLPDEERKRLEVRPAAMALLQSLDEVQEELGAASLAEIKDTSM